MAGIHAHVPGRPRRGGHRQHLRETSQSSGTGLVKVHLANIEALGCGTIAWDAEANQILPHIHVAVGLKQHSADGYTSHLLAANVQFLTELLIVEVSAPAMRRPANRPLQRALLTFGE
ncbi:hypothetical protein [Nonomuraea rubra]|uniref:Putative DNA-binding protein with PD1-like motif n=1 Tax=Nonomuraea rubra TaxID=46180 RepID=A0A7X0NNX2_9ACTN|nr:hypothetical protein [Nonomuraea rubra]MBB6546878.1 putative DNA-binding protein with PD1-like motif [Nonomuraea rubra]